MIGDGKATGWGSGCLVHRACDVRAPDPPRCPAGLPVRDWTEALAAASQPEQRVNVRGRLGHGPLAGALGLCSEQGGRGCCNRVSAPVWLDQGTPLLLEGFACDGDDSLVCCNAPAYGQALVASGRLSRARPGEALPSAWVLRDVTLCAER